MKFPIIELREHNLWVRLDLGGTLEDATLRIRHNLANNRTRHVVDSNADAWTFDFVGTDHRGLRRLASALWNISSDYYTLAREPDISVGRFRSLVEPHLGNIDPDQAQMALSLLEPIAACDASDRLRKHLHLLDL